RPRARIRSRRPSPPKPQPSQNRAEGIEPGSGAGRFDRQNAKLAKTEQTGSSPDPEPDDLAAKTPSSPKQSRRDRARIRSRRIWPPKRQARQNRADGIESGSGPEVSPRISSVAPDVSDSSPAT